MVGVKIPEFAKIRWFLALAKRNNGQCYPWFLSRNNVVTELQRLDL